MEFDRRWLDPDKAGAELAARAAEIAADPELLAECFGGELEFGTAGLRGILDAGTARMNRLTVGKATQGLARVLLEDHDCPGVAIAYDSRHFSREFAEEAAGILAANGVHVWIYPELMPTPALSYAVRELGCQSGIMITASHNPPEYNGYKVYDHTGGQIVSEFAQRVSEAIASVDPFDGVRRSSLEEGLQSGSIEYLTQEFIDGYIEAVLRLQLEPGIFRKSGLKIAYSPLNGAGHKSVIAALSRAGLEEIYVVADQSRPNGDFPTCPSPNPENPDTMKMTLDLGRYIQADIAFATDPDSDRIGVAAPEADGSWRLFTGNELGVLLLDYICRQRTAQGTMPRNPVAVMSIVSTPMAARVAEHWGVEMRRVLTGFKYIGDVMNQLVSAGEPERFLMGFEESCGYLTGMHVRDKDAVNAALLVCEMAAHYKLEGRTLCAVMDELYAEYGTYYTKADSFAFAGAGAMERMGAVMDHLRAEHLPEIAGTAVTGFTDYRDTSATGLPSADVLTWELADGCAVTARPSGTEPKLKLYFTVRAGSREECLQRYDALRAAMTGAAGL